jgi:hypothetical protein
MFRPFVFIGLGGSGGKTLRFLKRDLSTELRRRGWTSGAIPDAWQFLHIDTPTVQDGMELNALVPPLEAGQYVGLIGKGVSFNDVAQQLDNTVGMSDEFVGWRVSPTALKMNLSLGAGKYRAVGRTVAMAHATTIRNRIRQAIDLVSTPDAESQLSEVYAALTGLGAPPTTQEPIVVVVSSLAGGSGAGMLMAVCDLVRGLCPGDASKPIALLYTPEVFGGGDGANSVQANSLAAISELLNGTWLHADALDGATDQRVKPRQPRDLMNAGAAVPLTQSGPTYPFLIGMKNNNGVSFGSDRTLFATVGSALVSWIIDPVVQDTLLSYRIGNWHHDAAANQSVAEVVTNLGGPTEAGLPAFSGLGVARVSIGLEYFERYASQRVALAAMRWAARAHLESDIAQSVRQRAGLRDPEQVATEIARQQLGWFLRQCGLAELGADQNQVLEALKPDDHALRAAMKSQVRTLAGVPGGGAKPAQQWASRDIVPAIETCRTDYDAAYASALRERMAAWSAAAPKLVHTTVETALANWGLKVTAALVRQAAAQLADPSAASVVAELRGETEVRRFSRWADKTTWSRAVADELAPLGQNKVDGSHPLLQQAIDKGLSYSVMSGEARLRERAADLLDQFTNGFLEPLARSLEQAAVLAEVDLQEVATVWPEWRDGEPPEGLRPPPSDYTLIEPAEMAGLFSRLLADTLGASSDIEQRTRVRAEVLSGSFLREMNERQGRLLEESAVTVLQGWWPGTMVFPDDHRPKSVAVFGVRTRPDDIERRSRQWLNRQNTPFEELLRCTLRTYLESDPDGSASKVPESEYEQRRRRFLAKFNGARAAAAPLVQLDPPLMGMLHPELAAQPYIEMVTTVPFLSHALEDEMRNVLRQIFGDDAKVDGTLRADGSVRHIDIHSTMKMPCSPLVFRSLMHPIAEEWTRLHLTDTGRQKFWSMRRARRLDQFVPVPQEHLICMIRGWFVGRMLGLVDTTSSPVRIARRGEAPAAFPTHLLSASGDERDRLPILLESLALAMVTTSQVGNLHPLYAYAALRDLGRASRSDTRVLPYGRLGEELHTFVESGIVAGQLVAPLVTGSDRNERLTSMEELLLGTIDGYRADFAALQPEWERSANALGEPPWWPGIHEQIDGALGDLERAVRKARAEASAWTRM